FAGLLLGECFLLFCYLFGISFLLIGLLFGTLRSLSLLVTFRDLVLQHFMRTVPVNLLLIDAGYNALLHYSFTYIRGNRCKRRMWWHDPTKLHHLRCAFFI